MEIAKDVYSYYFNEGNDSEDTDNAEKDAEDTEEQAGDDDTEESAEQD
jgi:hypothetical protein